MENERQVTLKSKSKLILNDFFSKFQAYKTDFIKKWLLKELNKTRYS